MKLNAKQKAAVERWCYAELAELANNDFGDVFKDRYETQPDEVSDFGETEGEAEIAELADDYFFVVMSRLAEEFRKKGKRK